MSAPGLSNILPAVASMNSPVNMPYPGRRAKRVKLLAVASILILLTTTSTLFPVFPQLLASIFPQPFDATLQKSSSDSNSQSGLPPSVSLPPGTIQYGFRDTPVFNQALDSSISPHLIPTPTAFVYQTSFGTFSFNRSTPFTFSLNSRFGAALTRGSFFFVNSAVPLTPGLANVTVATDWQYKVSYEVLFGSTVVGNLVLQVSFFADVKPKFTATLSLTTSWTFGNFNIIWSTVTRSQWVRGLGRTVLNLETIPGVQRINGTSRTDAGGVGEISHAD